jgi:hypothetical protein
VIEKGLRHRKARATVCATIGAATLFGVWNPALADSFDPSRPTASLLSVEQPSVTLSPGIGVSRTEQIIGTDSIVLPFVIAGGMPAGTVTVTLQDLGWEGPFSSLSFAATTSTSLLAQLAAPGSLTFGIAGAGNYFATVYGVADPNFGSGLYSLNLKYSPVPLPMAAWLLLSGLALLPRKTNRHQRSLV